MGRNLPSATNLAFDQITQLESFYGALARRDQLLMDKFFEHIMQHRSSLSNASSLLPLTVVPFVLLLESHKSFENGFNRLHAEIEELKKRATGVQD